MSSFVKSGVVVGAAMWVAVMVGAVVGDEPANSPLQGSWNDYPAKWIGNGEVPTVTPPSTNDTPGQTIPSGPVDWGPNTPNTNIPGILVPPRQQQQGKPSGGLQWGGKTGGGAYFNGGKTGGSFDWGKMRPPQSQQGGYPIPGGGQGQLDQAKLLEYIRALQQQNAQLRELLARLAAQQNGSGERSPDLPSGGVPLQ